MTARSSLLRHVLPALFGLWSTLGFAALPDPPQAPPAPPGVSGAALLPELAAATARPATLDERGLHGPGAEFLRELIRDARYVMLGEDHGSSGIARFATALWQELQPRGFGVAAIEVDPWTAAWIESSLRDGGIDALRTAIVEGRGALGVPFYAWQPEAEFAAAVVERAPPGRALWGLDQVFLGAAAPLLQTVAAEARSSAARTLAAELAAKAAADPYFLPRVGTAELPRLRTLLHPRDDRALLERVDAMVESGAIYDAFTGGKRDPYPANLQREALMKRAFRAELAAARARGSDPRVFFKFGGNHLARGLSTTLVPSLGNDVAAEADARGERTVHVLAICGPGGSIATFSGAPQPCEQGLNRMFGTDWKHLVVGPVSVIDLRVWRQRPSRWEHFPSIGRRWIEAYDAMVIVSGTPASTLLPGVDPPKL
jgi:hypothetical protein